MAAALFFRRQAGKDATCLVLDDHTIFGGKAKRNEFEVNGHRLVAHQASALHFVPYPFSFIAREAPLRSTERAESFVLVHRPDLSR